MSSFFFFFISPFFLLGSGSRSGSDPSVCGMRIHKPYWIRIHLRTDPKRPVKLNFENYILECSLAPGKPATDPWAILYFSSSTGSMPYIGPPHARVSHLDQKSTKTPNLKSRLYWCLIEFLDWRYSHVGIFDSSCELALSNLLTWSSTSPFPVWISTGVCI